MKPISKLSKRAETIFNRLTVGLVKVGDHKKWDNAPGAFMAACVEIIDQTKAGKIVSIAHYYEQNGDLMRDPDCTFLVAGAGIFPLSFRQDSLGIDNEYATVQSDGKISYNPRQQNDLTKFANQFLVNVAQQQF